MDKVEQCLFVIVKRSISGLNEWNKYFLRKGDNN